jgi:hypothetical protein
MSNTRYIGVDIDPLTKQMERPGVEIVIGDQVGQDSTSINQMNL